MDLPIACTLTPDELQARRSGLLPGVLDRADRIEPLAEGYRLCFAASTDALQAVTAMVDAERQCCRFLRFALTIEPDLGPLVLDVTGPPGTRDFLGSLIDRAT
jgi:hypothetical protein